MLTILRNILAVIAGLVVGSLVNFGIIMMGIEIVPLPEGVDMMNPESLSEAMKDFGPKEYFFPILAHALGTLVGAWLTARLAGTKARLMGMIIGLLFLIGGISNAITLGFPPIPMAVDLVLAYLPMAWIGSVLGERRRQGASKEF